jgi:hypothetical protein
MVHFRSVSGEIYAGRVRETAGLDIRWEYGAPHLPESPLGGKDASKVKP